MQSCNLFAIITFVNITKCNFLKAVTVIFTDFNPQELIEKIINNKYVSKVIGYVKNNKILVKFASVAVIGVMAVVISLASTGITFGFNVKYSGRILGTVGSRSVCVDARNIAIENVSSENADSAICAPKLSLTLTVPNQLDDAQKVAEAIIESSDDIVNGTMLIVNGKVVACVQATGLDKLLDARLMSYNIAGAENTAEFVDDVKCEVGYYLKDDLTELGDLETVVNSLKVKTVSKYNTDVIVPYSTTRIKTDRMPNGFYEVTKAGSNGLKRKSLIVESVDGIETSRTETGVEVITPAVNRVITVGTGKVQMSASEKANVTSAGFICPLTRGSFKISSYYGDGRNHKGMDLAANKGVSIYAAAAGTVTYAGYDGDYGYNVIIDHGNGMKTRYAHASYLSVSCGQTVAQGEMLAAVGSTGYSTGNHLHFEVIVNGTRVNPAPYIGLN